MASNPTKTASKTAAKSTALAPIDQFKGIVKHDDKQKPYVEIEYELSAEGLEDLEPDDIPVTIPICKLLQKGSEAVDAELDGAKAGVFWNENNASALPENMKVVPVYSYKVKYPPSEMSPEGSEVSYVVFMPFDYIKEWEKWLPRVLNNDPALGAEVMNNTIALGFQSTGLTQYKKLQSNALNTGSLFATAYVLGSIDRSNNKGKWKQTSLTAAARLDEGQLFAARSASKLVRMVSGRMEAYYAKRREAMGIAPEPEDASPQSDVSDI